MKKYVIILFMFASFVVPISIISAKGKDKGYDLIAEVPKENIVLYAKKDDGLYRDFKIDFKGWIFTESFWINDTNPTYKPQLFYEDLNGDGNKELIVILTLWTGTELHVEEVHVFDYREEYGLTEVLIDNPMAIINKNIKSKITPENAELVLNGEVFKYDTSFIESSYLSDDISFESIIHYRVINNQLIVESAALITQGSVIGDVIITYEYRDKMYQDKSIEFKMNPVNRPIYGPTKY